MNIDEAYKFMMEKTGQYYVPAIVIENDIIAGFDQTKIEAALAN